MNSNSQYIYSVLVAALLFKFSFCPKMTECYLLSQSPVGSGLALAISQASHFLQPPPHQSIIIERMHSGKLCSNMPYLFVCFIYLLLLNQVSHKKPTNIPMANLLSPISLTYLFITYPVLKNVCEGMGN